MTSEIYWALLGLVISRPSYGFELARRFERTYGDVLHLSGVSHSYTALNRLEELGLIEIVPGTRTGRQPKPHYRATAVGLRSYEEWLVDQIDGGQRRQELWIRELAIFAHDPETALRVIDRFEAKYLKRAGEVGDLPDSGVLDSPSQFVDELVAQQQRIAVGGMLSWLRAARETFEARAQRRSVDGAPRA